MHIIFNYLNSRDIILYIIQQKTWIYGFKWKNFPNTKGIFRILHWWDLLLRRKFFKSIKSVAKLLKYLANVTKLLTLIWERSKIQKFIVFIHDIPTNIEQSCISFYKKHLLAEKWKNIYEVYLNYCHKRSVYYYQRGEKNLKT